MNSIGLDGESRLRRLLALAPEQLDGEGFVEALTSLASGSSPAGLPSATKEEH